MASSYPYGFDILKSYFQRASENDRAPTLSEFVSLNVDFIARSSPKTNEKLNGTWNKRFVTAAEILKIKESVVPLPSDNVEASVVVDEPDWSRVFEERFKMQISSSRREKTYMMYSNENEHVGEQLLEDQRKRTIEDDTITSDTKKASIAKTFNVSFDEYVDSIENDKIEISDDSEILDVEPLSGWEFDTPMPSWLKKAMHQHKTLTTTQTDPSEKFKLAKQPIWWRIIDASDPKIVQDFISEEEFSELNAIFSNVLSIGHQNDWTVLEPVAERCLQSLAKLNNEQIRMIGEMVKYEGIHGAVRKLQKIIQNIEELNIEEPDLFDDEPTNNKTLSFVLEENDYLDKDVGYILELVRYTCEMLGKGIPQRKNSERDIDMFIKRHIFACFDDILDTHFGEMVSRSSRDRRSEAMDAPDKVEGFHLDWMFTRHDLGKDISYGREFSLCERAGSKVDNDTKNVSDILKVLKTLKDMHRSLVKAIAIESGGALSKQVLNACKKLIMPGFASSWFYLRAVLIVYVGGGFYTSFELGKFDIPTSYDEIWKLTKIARIMLQIKKLLCSTVSRFKRIMERAEKEKFLPGKVTIVEAKESRTPNKPQKAEKPKPEV
ncbi:7746_t:CDS:10 [Ambispora leptoticha]|uniref:7746_t:CDS:1 n=1 Tax=Ambispora leptoticha TaxID=144679 RepID=A0A9N9FK71_9GLOM|nr:7746_t:CDS:10 [Ambispora leptoticha]